jgi:hypothetical protein
MYPAPNPGLPELSVELVSVKSVTVAVPWEMAGRAASSSKAQSAIPLRLIACMAGLSVLRERNRTERSEQTWEE